MKKQYINYKADIQRLKEVKPEVESLLVTYKKITKEELSSCLQFLPNLVKIQITYTALDEFPPEIFEYKDLFFLLSYGNPIKKVPDEISKLKKLRIFSITNTKLDYLSDALFDLPLTSLEMDGNQLTEFPQGIQRCKEMKYLKLSDNEITHLPEECFENLYPVICKLWLRNNKLDNFPLRKAYPHLDYLDLTNNQVTEWNDKDSGFPILQMLHMFECKLQHVEFHHDYNNLSEWDASWNQLKEFPKGIEHLSNVRYLKLEGNQFTSIPPETKTLTNLFEFNFDKALVQNVPDRIAKLNYQYEEDYTNRKDPNIPLSAFQNKDARYMVLDYIDQPILPDDIPASCPVVHLSMKNCNLKQLPKNIDKLTRLYVLDLSENQLEELPSELSKCKELETLIVKKNKLQNFRGYDAIKSLTSIEIDGNPCINNIEDLMSKRAISVKGFNWESISMNKRIFLPFAAALAKSPLSEEEKLECLNYIKIQKQIKLPIDTFSQKIKALCIPYREQEMRARKQIYESQEKQLQDHPLNTETVLFIAGKPSQKKTEIKKQCKDLGITVQSKYNDKVSHILLGRMPKELLQITDCSAVFVTESDISTLHKTENPDFLEQADSEMISKVREMLRSNSAESINLAAEILKNGGIPQDLFYDVLFVIKTHYNFDGIKKLNKLIKPLLPQDLEGVLKSRAKLDYADEKESDINKKLRKNERVWGKDFCLYMSLELYRKRKRGLRYLMTNTELHHPLRLQAIQLLQKDELLNWHAVYGFQRDWWREGERRRALKIPFPVEIEDKSKVERLNLRRCKLHELPKGMEQFTALKRIDLCTNGLKELPDWLADFQNLEFIDLSDNYLSEFPEVLYKLPRLKKVIFGKQNIRSYSSLYDFIKAPDDITTAFPNTEFVFEVEDRFYSSDKTTV